MNGNTLEQLLDEKELAQLIRVSVPTLRYWRSTGQGPRFRKVGQMVRYAPSDINAWLNSHPTGGEPMSLEGRLA